MGRCKRQREAEPTTLMSLRDDMLAEILHRLPSQPDLARAAFACPRLRNVASSSAVANSRVDSPGPLLGYFVSVVGGDIPSFHRALLGSYRDVAAIVRCGDFHLADFEEYKWRLMDCRHGLLLLTSDRGMAVFDPISRSQVRIPRYMSNGGRRGKSSSFQFHCFLPSCGDSTASVRVLCVESTDAHVYSSCTGEWCSQYLPAPKGIRPSRRADPHTYRYHPMHAGGRIFWRTRGKMLTSLDLVSMNFSHVALPAELDHLSPYAVGDTEDGTTCLLVARSAGYMPDIQVWFLKEEDGLSSSWERQRSVDVSEWDHLGVAKVCDVTAGVVLLSMGYKQKHQGLRYRAFRLSDTLRESNTKRQPVFLADFYTSGGWVQPYFMAWPRPSIKAAGSSKNAYVQK